MGELSGKGFGDTLRGLAGHYGIFYFYQMSILVYDKLDVIKRILMTSIKD